MRAPSYLIDRTEGLDVKMTPMIDVVFLLLIFFVWSASFRVVEYSLASSLLTPAGQGIDAEIDSQLIDLERVVIRIQWDQTRPAWLVNEQPAANMAAVRSILARVHSIQSELPVVIDPDAQVPLGFVIDAYDVSRQEGFSTVQFVANSI